MKIIISNNPEKEIYAESYDLVIYLGITPDKELESNERIILSNDVLTLDNNLGLISKNGVNKNNTQAIGKYNFISNHKKGITQILLNDRHTNIKDDSNNGYTHYFVGLGTHYEFEL